MALNNNNKRSSDELEMMPSVPCPVPASSNAENRIRAYQPEEIMAMKSNSSFDPMNAAFKSLHQRANSNIEIEMFSTPKIEKTSPGKRKKVTSNNQTRIASRMSNI